MHEINRRALEAARNPRYRIVAFEGLLNALSGGNQAGSAASGQYQQAANQSNKGYQNAEAQLVSSTGSPAAQTFEAEENAALQPQFRQQDANLAASNAAQGITDSGSGNFNGQELAGQQSGAIASADAPLFSEALQQYGNMLSEGAGANSSLLGQGAGAYNTADANANNSLIDAGQDIGSAIAGIPPTGSPNPQSVTAPSADGTDYNANPYSYVSAAATPAPAGAVGLGAPAPTGYSTIGAAPGYGQATDEEYDQSDNSGGGGGGGGGYNPYET
jgi:hypothetical protein